MRGLPWGAPRQKGLARAPDTRYRHPMKLALALASMFSLAAFAACGSTSSPADQGSSDAGDAGGGQPDARDDTAPPVDAGADSIPSSDAGAIQAQDGKWTWVPFADAKCRDGSSTGIGVNLNRSSTKVMIFLEGGGACF